MERIKDHLIALFTVFIWGITFVCTKYLTGALSSLEILFVRYLIAYIALWVVAPRPFKFAGLRHEGLMLAAALSGAALYQFMENLAVCYTSPASVSFITATAPLFTAILAHKFLGEKFGIKGFFGMLVSVFGVFLICFGDSKTIETGLLGDIIIACSIWLWAVYSVLIKKLAALGYGGALLTRRLFFYSVIVMLPFVIATGDISHAPALLRPEVGLNLLFLGILASAVCFATWNRSVERLGVTTTSKYLFISPIITLLAQAVCSMGTVSAAALFGMAVTLAGIGISEFGKNK